MKVDPSSTTQCEASLSLIHLYFRRTVQFNICATIDSQPHVNPTPKGERSGWQTFFKTRRLTSTNREKLSFWVAAEIHGGICFVQLLCICRYSVAREHIGQRVLVQPKLRSICFVPFVEGKILFSKGDGLDGVSLESEQCFLPFHLRALPRNTETLKNAWGWFLWIFNSNKVNRFSNCFQRFFQIGCNFILINLKFSHALKRTHKLCGSCVFVCKYVSLKKHSLSR